MVTDMDNPLVHQATVFCQSGTFGTSVRGLRGVLEGIILPLGCVRSAGGAELNRVHISDVTVYRTRAVVDASL